MQAEVTAQIEKARNEPKNFDAQVKAAELYYQIQRYDPAIEFLLKANQLKPDDYQTIVALGLVNLDAGHYDVAEKWYKAAVLKKKDDVPRWPAWPRRPWARVMQKPLNRQSQILKKLIRLVKTCRSLRRNSPR